MTDQFDRRRFLKRLGYVGAGVAGSTAVGLLAKDKGRYEPVVEQEVQKVQDFTKGLDARKPLLVVGTGDPVAATKAAIHALGGMKRFIRPKERVVIKPNVAWDRTPVQAANTNPQVVATLVELCRSAGASEVVVTDHTCNDAERCFTRSGIWKAVKAAGGEVRLAANHRFEPRDLGGVLGRLPVLTPVVAADRLINVGIAKHHGLSKFTGAMKNLYGVIGGRRNRHHQKIDDSICDLADAFRATLSIVDATRVLLRNGPQGGDLGDTKAVGQIIASTDPVAVDAYACTLIGLDPKELPYLTMAEKRGLGTANQSAIPKKEVS
jgi:uncharacterized protein (DUF362 family)